MELRRSGRATGLLPRAARVALGVPAGAKSTTGPILRRLRVLLAGGTALALASSLWAFAAMHRFAEVVHTRALPAVLELSAAQAALVDADAVAVQNLGRPGQPLALSSTRFQSLLAIASQNLAQVAEHNVAGEDGSQILQSVQGQLVAYQDLIAQADAHYQQRKAVLGAITLWNAYQLLHDGGDAILPQLKDLTERQQSTIDRLAMSGWMNRWSVPLWLVPLVLLTVLLVGAQLFLRRRFRRAVNLWLLPATVVILGVTVYCGALAVAHHGDGGRDGLRVLIEQRQNNLDRAEGTHRPKLLGLVRKVCVSKDCGETVRSLAQEGIGLETPVDRAAVGPADLATQAKQMDRRTAPPGGRFGLMLIAVSTVLVGALTWAGLQRPINEYRFQQR